jgi:hypothetical protein
VCDEGFDDHAHKGAIDHATFERLVESAAGETPQRVDFVVVHVADPEVRHVRFEDGAFYEFHDQWLWFRLMNGVSACGSSADPVRGQRFETIAAIEESLRGKVQLPLDLVRTTGGRYVSPTFYTLAYRAEPRVYAPGTLFRRVGEGGAADRWWFELEVSDPVKEADLVTIHRTLEDALPAGASLFWRALSPDQSALGTTLQRGGGPLAARVLRLGEEPP